MRPSHGPNHRRHAFTLVELLVVIAIVALLLAMTLPSFRRAREQGRRTLCAGNLHDLSTSMLTYALEYDSFPLVLVFSQANPDLFGFSSWAYGGWEGSNASFWKSFRNGIFHSPTHHRPLSAYMFGRHDLRADEELPVFRCPSDAVSRFSAGSSFTPLHDQRLAAYEDYGTSYSMNISWWWQVHRLTAGFQGGLLSRWEEDLALGNQVWRKYAQRHAARFVMVGEDPFLGAVNPDNPRREVMGLHRRFSTHNLAFLDGHVVTQRTDTRVYHEADWTVVDEDLPDPPY